MSPNLQKISPLFNDREMAQLITHHNHPEQKSYTAIFSEPSLDDRVAVFDKLCLSAVIPGFTERPETFIPADQFTPTEIKNILWMLEFAQVRSQFTYIPDANKENMLVLAIRDSDNPHLVKAGKSAVAAIEQRKSALISQQTINEFISRPLETAVPDQLVKIEILVTENKGLYIPIAKLTVFQREDLNRRLENKQIPAEYYNSPSQGEVLRTPHKNWSALLQVQTEIAIEIDMKATEGLKVSPENDPRNPEYHLRTARENARAQLEALNLNQPQFK